VYRNQWLRLREDKILRSNGQAGIYGVVDKDDCAVILPIDQGRVWLVEQFRYTIQERALELPQGGWEMEVDDPEELARGELKEETGLHAAEMTCLGWMWIAYGFHPAEATCIPGYRLDRPVIKIPDPEEHDLSISLGDGGGIRRHDAHAGKIRDASTLGSMGALPVVEESAGCERMSCPEGRTRQVVPRKRFSEWRHCSRE
jgi:ADP-ribose pyrophosphatase